MKARLLREATSSRLLMPANLAENNFILREETRSAKGRVMAISCVRAINLTNDCQAASASTRPWAFE